MATGCTADPAVRRLGLHCFSNEYSDDDLGLIYYNYRYYSPKLGRWLSRDPIEEQGGLNLYGFVGNGPYNAVDRLGMAAYEDIEDAGADQFAKGNPVRGGLWIAYGVAWNAFSFGSLEKNSALVEKYKGGKISSEACDKGMAINSVKSGVQLAITATGAGALRGGLAATEIIKDAAIVGVTQATTASVEVGADRTVSHVTGQPYTKSTAQDNTYIACNGLYGFTFGCYGSGFGQLGGYYGGRFANYTSRLTLLPKPPPVPIKATVEEAPAFPLPLHAPEGVTLKSCQDGLNSNKTPQIPGLIKAMSSGDEIPYIAGFRQGNTYYISEGNHRVAAALKIFNETGDSGPLMKLLQEGNWVPKKPEGPTWDLTN